MTGLPPLSREKFLTVLFKKAEHAGYGIADGPSFEAFPGCEDAAADFIEEWIGND